MNILITGVHGFVGSNLKKALQPGHSIFGLDIVFTSKESIVNTYFWADLENNGLSDVDVIIHLAEKAHDTKNQSKAQEYSQEMTHIKIYV